MDYPAGLHEVQVLDDSTDGSLAISERVVNELRAAGKAVTLIHREKREGYKAGALAHGLTHTQAELVAIFDADFLPPQDFLLRMVPQLMLLPKAAFIQSRWGHLNAKESLLTLAQSAHVDAHFYVQQHSRAAMDWLMNFNGSGGVWRVAAIQDAGGWQGDTLTEDLDLSHRAAMRGWTALYDDSVVVPAELPNTWSAYRQQQYRWAMGSTQTLKKLLLPLWRSELTVMQKLIGTLHLGQYLVQPLLLLHCLLVPWWPMNSSLGGQVLMLGALATALLPVMKRGRSRWSALPAMMLMGAGLAWTGTRAVVAAFAGKRVAFLRTPKAGAGLGKVGSITGEALLLVYAVGMLWLHGLTLLPSMAMHLTGNAFVCALWWLEWKKKQTVEDVHAHRVVG
jgi:cellulose synthase/poly-beta-1,6-N-acetylglucosamine synthase-like glycosyltransferase